MLVIAGLLAIGQRCKSKVEYLIKRYTKTKPFDYTATHGILRVQTNTQKGLVTEVTSGTKRKLLNHSRNKLEVTIVTPETKRKLL